MLGIRSLLFVAFSATLSLSVSSGAAKSAPTDTLSLDGKWEIVFDVDNAGRDGDWQLEENFNRVEGRRAIDVPSAWERIEKDYEGVAFYRREFEVPADWKDKVVRIQFGAVNYLSELWINDEAIGVNEGGFTPFEFRIDRVLKPGEMNSVALRVVGPIMLQDKNIDGIGQLETVQWRGGLTAGIWQSVQLVATGDTYVKDVFLRPNLGESSATFEVELDQTGVKTEKVDLEIEIFSTEEGSKKIAVLREDLDLRPGTTRKSWTIKMPGALPWSPEFPNLYKARLTVSTEGHLSDSWSHRFGLRHLTLEEGGFELNGEPIYIKATFFEGLYPRGIANPDSEEMIRTEIRLAKEAGFNMIRPWRRPPVPQWLDIADEMGVLVIASPAIECMRLPHSTPYLPRRIENEIRETILRDRNRTCIVQWELFNELHRPILMQAMRPMAMMARDLDPTRLILDESGGWAFGANMYLPYEYEPTKINDIHNYPGPFINNQLFDGYLAIGMSDDEKKTSGFTGNTPGRNVVAGIPSFISEIGYGSLPDLSSVNELFQEKGEPLAPAYRYHARLQEEQERMIKESGFDYLFPDFDDFVEAQQEIHGMGNKRMLEAIRSNPNVRGFCVHALTGGDWVLGAGLLDIWRQPKGYVYEGTKAANQPRILALRAYPRNVYSDEGVKIEVTGINDLDSIPSLLEVDVLSESGKSVFKKELSFDYTHGVSRIFEKEVDARRLSGTYTIKARALSEKGDVLAKNEYEIEVFSSASLKVPAAEIAVLDLGNTLTPFLEESGVRYSSFSKDTAADIPVFITSLAAKEAKDKALLSELVDFIESGGTAVYIQGSGTKFDRSKSTQIKKLGLPVSGNVEHAMGLWSCIPHLVRDHPIFDGLPSDTVMRDIYQNVYPKTTLRDLGGESVASSIGYEWFSHEDDLQYSGPGESWWGADLAIVPFGKGRCVISELRIVENLGKDPVADMIFFNLVNFASE
ncbi:glycoside hydrolase family 2 protein [Pelagicoccus mobilis]|uniref:Beta-galactosidase n=1 Tax=Pelagicoccus mobilis TaxID=415221 RepID=A0A934RS97_9BACT|nr:sugar-binding domain-containing protein [Pelagicoccus mobilis]MBK1875473.1 hypothetical protein [Pelagicoccus mobilis]